MSLTREEQGVLLTLHEYSRLWEIASELGDISATDPASVRSKAAEILRDFARRGWLQLRRERIVSKDIEGDAVVVPVSKLEGILGDERNWLVPSDREEPEFDSTSSRRRRLRRR